MKLYVVYKQHSEFPDLISRSKEDAVDVHGTHPASRMFEIEFDDKHMLHPKLHINKVDAPDVPEPQQ